MGMTMGTSGHVREPAVAGRFYPGRPEELAGEVDRLLAASAPADGVRRAVGVMAPHAGYVFSGAIAARAFAAVEVPEHVVVLGPNHTGLGRRIAVIDRGSFRIPGAVIPVAEALADAILAEAELAAPDTEAHRYEHSLEVELPFLLARQPALQIVPICSAGLRADEAIALGEAIHRAVTRLGVEVLVVASSDMSHYLRDDDARRLDRVALQAMLSADPNTLYATVAENDISMCGFIPATVLLAYGRAAGAKPPELVGYATSGDAFGERDRVVGYAAVVLPS
jgi:hypothetical protein